MGELSNPRWKQNGCHAVSFAGDIGSEENNKDTKALRIYLEGRNSATEGNLWPSFKTARVALGFVAAEGSRRKWSNGLEIGVVAVLLG